jgi:hypothetical protein
MLNVDADSTSAKTGARVLRLKVKSIRDPDRPAEAREIPIDDLQVKVVNLPGLGAGAGAVISTAPAQHDVEEDDAKDSHSEPGDAGDADDQLQIRRLAKRSNIPQELAQAYLDLNRRWAFIWKPHCIFDVATGDLYSIKAFQSIEAANKIDIPLPNGKGAQTIHVAAAWCAWKYRRAYSSMVYAPGSAEEIAATDRHHPPSFNLWRGFSVEPKQGDIALWGRLLDHLFGDANEARSYFERWCASQIQNVGVKHHAAVMLWGTVQGSGKSLTGELIGSLFGDSFHELSNIAWRSNFNGWARCRRFILINEIVTSRDNDIDLLKNLISQQSIDINQKGIEQYKLDDTISYLLTSNKPDALKLEDSDRRFWIWEVARLIDQKLANSIGRWKRTNEGRAALLHHLMHLDLDDFDPRVPAPMTIAKENMIAAGRATIDDFVRDEADTAREGHAPPVVLVDQLLQRFPGKNKLKDPARDMGNALGAIPTAARLKQVRISRELAIALGLHDANDDPQFPQYGRRCRPWALLDKEKWLAATEAEIRRVLESAIPHPS